MMRVMIQGTTAALAQYGLHWEIKSAEMPVSPTEPRDDRHLLMESPTMDGAREEATFKFVDALMILGCAIDGVGSPETMLQHRLAAAERAYRSKLKIWSTKTTRAVKLEAWIRFIHPIVLHGIRTLHLSRQILHTMRKWEFGLLRQIMKYRRRVCK